MDTLSKKRAFFLMYNSTTDTNGNHCPWQDSNHQKTASCCKYIWKDKKKNMPAIEMWLFVSFNLSQSATAIKSYKG